MRAIRKRQVRAWAALIGSGLVLAASASQAGASVTIGQLAPGSSPPVFCDTLLDHVQPTVSSGNAYVVPATGGITSWTVSSWSTNAGAGAGQMLTMKIFRKTGEPATYTAVSHDGPRPLLGDTVNTFPTSLSVKPGDVLGLNEANSTMVNNACLFVVSGETEFRRDGNLADGESGDFNPAANRLNISAVVAPTNTFSPGAITRNKKKGTATLTVDVPNPGELTGSGNGAKVASSTGRAVTSKSVASGSATLLIKAKGKKKKKLNATGKVKLNVAVTYTPTGGDPKTQSLKVKLKKNL